MPKPIALKVGDRIHDNDPRMAPRVLTIVRLDASHVYATSPAGREVRILRGSIHADGKLRRTGFSLEVA